MEGRERLPPLLGGIEQPPLIPPKSSYSPTFNEFQNTLDGAGKHFGSMHLEELLKNIGYANESLLMPSSSVASLMGSTETGAFGLQTQGSLMTLPCAIGSKTADEVSRDLFMESGCAGDERHATASIDLQHQHLEPKLGGTPLEGFLMGAGVVKEESVASERSSVSGATAINTNNTGNSNNPNSNMFFGHFTGLPGAFTRSIRSYDLTDTDVNLPTFQLGNISGLEGQQRVVEGAIFPGGASVAAAEIRSPKYPALDELGISNGDVSSLFLAPYVFKRGPVKNSGELEKAVERRQQRMIKNRESAARSRARKQAYTIELELEVANLKERNQELWKKQGILEVEKKKVLKMIIQQPSTKRQSLRTQTGP